MAKDIKPWANSKLLTQDKDGAESTDSLGDSVVFNK
jgi:hypothetical protein